MEETENISFFFRFLATDSEDIFPQITYSIGYVLQSCVVNMDDPKSILVRMPNWVGDLVMATGVLKRLRKAYPKAHITAMALDPIGQILKEDSAIDELFLFRKCKWFSRHQDTLDVAGKIRLGQYDLGILLTNSFSSAWWFWRGKIKQRVGFGKDFRSLLLTESVSFPPKKIHQIEEYQYLLDQLKIPGPHTSPYLVLRKEEIDQALDLLKTEGVNLEKDRIVVIHPGAAYGMAKCWPIESFKTLTEKLLEHKNIKIVFVGDLAISQMLKRIFDPISSNFINLAGRTSLRELAAIIKCAHLFIGNDSGPMHIAAALKTPMIAIFGSTDPNKTAPRTENAELLCKKVPCSPCFLRQCPIDFRCMRSITPEEVYEKALYILGESKMKNRSEAK